MNMKPTVSTLLALAALGTAIGAQTPTTKKVQEIPRTAEASAGTSVIIQCPVAGLKQDNLAVVQTSLTDLTIDMYVCTPCKIEQIVPGRCGTCNTDLGQKKVPLLMAVSPSLENANVTLTLDQRHPTHLSKIESALARNSIKVDPAKLPIAGPAALVFHGGTADAVATVQQAFTASGLFGEVNASWEPVSSEIIVRVRPGRTPPTREQVTKVSEPLKLQLTDVVFGPVIG